MHLVDCFCELFAFVLHLLDTPEQHSEARQVYERCIGLVEAARERGKEHGYEQDRFEEALFAVIVWIDEAIFCSTLPLKRDWPNFLLQLHYFDTNNGGDEFYDHLDVVNLQDDQLVEVYTYCFALGFRGRLYGAPDALEEKRAQLFNTLNTELKSPPSDKLFPAGYRGGQNGKGYIPPKGQAARATVLFLLPLFALGCVYVICSYRLDVQLRAVLGM